MIKLPVPLMMPASQSILLAAKPSRKILIIGIPPATAASYATLTPLASALAKISLPCSASKALLAVTICLPCSIAAKITSLAVVVPPINSTTMSTSACLTISSKSADCLMSVGISARLRRVPTWVILISRPVRRVISSRLFCSSSTTPVPTVPSPKIAN